MIWDFLLICFLAIAPSLAGVIKDELNLCSSTEFLCDGSTCVSLERVCDGVADCADHSDEKICLPGANTSMVVGDVRFKRKSDCLEQEFQCEDGTCINAGLTCDNLIDCPDGTDETSALCGNFTDSSLNSTTRGKRQSGCQRNQFQCRDGSCISFDGKCDGEINCPDGSDETHPLCRFTACHGNLFRCTYGACVDGTAPCDGKQDCADNSDELLPTCFNETRTSRNRFKCDSGEEISVTGLCDGTADCADGSDENIRACAGKTCPTYLFQCAYGACVDQGADCDGKQDCADNSDESDELCNRTSTNVKPTQKPVSPGEGACVVPQDPENGKYIVQGAPFASSGQRFRFISLNASCMESYGVDGDNVANCFDGAWFPQELPKCTRYCRLRRHHSVNYKCEERREGRTIQRPCRDKEFPSTTVLPSCKTPNYYGNPSNMHCRPGGVWDQEAKCSAECGRVTPKGQEYIIGGKRVHHGELPWHTAIYRKKTRPYMQICGGSLTSRNTVISAAHCFWDEYAKEMLPPSMYAVALGTLYRPWNDSHEVGAQFSDVAEIHIPNEYDGSTKNFQSDIAILILTTEIEYQTFIRPVCVDFDYRFNNRQLQSDNLGQVAGWGLTAADGGASGVLLTVSLPFVPVKQCTSESPPDFREYITSDKFCAGFRNGTALCEGDSGGGLVFPETSLSVQRYYLRGIVSTAPRNNQKCDPFQRTTFSAIQTYEHFIKEYISFDA